MKVAAVVFVSFAVVALAVPTNRPKKTFKPNRLNRRIEGIITSTIRTYQPKYNPFKSTELLAFPFSSDSSLEMTVSSTPPMEHPIATLVEDFSNDTFIVTSEEESPVTSLSDSSRFIPASEIPISFSDQELFSLSPSSNPSDEVASSTSKSLISFSSSAKPSSEVSVFNSPILLRPSTSVFPFIKSQNKKNTSTALSTTLKPLASTVFHSFPRISSRAPKTLPSGFPFKSNRLPQPSAVPIIPHPSASSASRTGKSLSTTESPLSQTSTIYPLSTVSSSSFVSVPSRNTKSAYLQVEPDDSTNSESVNYNFSYMINDPITNQDFGHNEKRVGNNTKGRYDVLLPDGRRQVVDYHILSDSGYIADVTYQD